MLQQTTVAAKLFAARSAAGRASRAKHRPERFDDVVLRPHPRVTLRPPTPEEIEPLWRAASEAVATPLARPDVIARVVENDPETVWIFEIERAIAGGIALLHLNRAGVDHLRRGVLNARDPQPELLARAGEPPCGCYFWMAFKRHAAAAGVQNVLAILRRPRFRGAELWATPYTEDGRKALSRIGMRPADPPSFPGLYHSLRGPDGPQAGGC